MKKKKLLLVSLWCVSFLRAIAIAFCFFILYAMVAAFFFAVEFERQTDLVIPVVLSIVIFFYLLIADAPWVERNLKRLTKKKQQR